MSFIYLFGCFDLTCGERLLISLIFLEDFFFQFEIMFHTFLMNHFAYLTWILFCIMIFFNFNNFTDFQNSTSPCCESYKTVFMPTSICNTKLMYSTTWAIKKLKIARLKRYINCKILLERFLLQMNTLHVCPILTVRREGDVARAPDVDHLVSLVLLPVTRVADRKRRVTFRTGSCATFTASRYGLGFLTDNV